MSVLRMPLACTVALVLLGGLGGAAVAQEGQEAAGSESLTDESLFEITIPPELMPTVLGKINLERHELSPGSEVSVGIENEAIRGKSLYLAEGTLLVTPMVDAWAWRGGEAEGGTPEVAGAGEPTELAAGDVIYLPAVPAARLQPDATTVLANPGETTTSLLGFHAHDSSVPDRFPGWPTGMSGMALASGSEPAALERVLAGDTVFRLSRTTYAPGTAIVPGEGAAMTLAQVETGTVEQLSVGPGGEFTMEYGAGAGLLMRVPEGVERTWMAVGDDPAVLLELSVIPQAPVPANE